MTRLAPCPHHQFSKVSYRSPAAAQKARVKIASMRLASVRLYVYRCPHCDLWHLSSERPRRKAA